MQRAWLLLTTLGSACSIDVAPRESAQIHCDASADCPPSWSCASAARRCVDAATPDAEGPRVLSAVAQAPTTVLVAFDKLVAPGSVVLAGAFVITGATGEALGSIAATLLDDGQRVVVTTDAQTPEASYGLTAESVTDIWGNRTAGEPVSFVGFGTAGIRTPPELLSPRLGERVLSQEVDLVWAPRAQARSYTVEVAADASFSTLLAPAIVVAAAESTEAPPTTTRIVLPGARRTYWRVRADVTEPGVYASSSFERMDDGVYVYCPAADACDDTFLAGNLSEPVRSVRTGISLALLLGLRTVRIAARPNDAAYEVGIIQLPSGVQLLGGWDDTFAARDLVALRPTLRGALGAALIAQQLDAPTLLEGLRILGPTLSEQGTSLGILVDDTADHLLVRSCEIRGGDAPSGYSFAVKVRSPVDDDTHAPRFEASTLIGGNGLQAGSAFTSAAVKIEGSSPVFVGNVLIAGGHGASDNSGVPGAPGSVSYGVWLSFGGLTLDGNEAVLGGSGYFSTAVHLSGRFAEIKNNLKICGAAFAPAFLGALGYGIQTVGLSEGITLRDNALICGADATLVQGKSPVVYGAHLANTAVTIERSGFVAGRISLDPGFNATTKFRSYGLFLSTNQAAHGQMQVLDSTIATADVVLPAVPASSSHVGLVLKPGDLSMERSRIIVPAGQVAALYGLTANWEPDSSSVFQPMALRLVDTQITVGDLTDATRNQGVARAIGVFSASPWETSLHTLEGVAVDVASMPDASERFGLALDSPRGAMTRSRVSTHGEAAGASVALRVTAPAMSFAPAVDAARFLISNASLFAAGGASSTALELPLLTEYAGGWTLLAGNNTLAAGPSSDAVAVRLVGDKGAGVSKLYLGNNVLAATGAGVEDTCLSVASGTFAASLAGFRSNVFVGCGEVACQGSCLDAAALDASDGPAGALDLSLSVAAADVAFVASSEPVDFELTPSSKQSFCEHGADLTAPGLCPALGACLVVTDDFAGRARTVPLTPGAYERDACAP